MSLTQNQSYKSMFFHVFYPIHAIMGVVCRFFTIQATKIQISLKSNA